MYTIVKKVISAIGIKTGYCFKWVGRDNEEIF